MRKRRTSSTTSSHSPAAISNWAYTPEQEQKLWEAFTVNIYPGASRYAELAEELGLQEIVVKRFFTGKRGSLFRRLTRAGEGGKVLKIKQACNVSPRRHHNPSSEDTESLVEVNQWLEKLEVPVPEMKRNIRYKDLDEKLDEVEKMLNQKLEKLEKATPENKPVKQEHPIGQPEQKETVDVDVYLPINHHQDHLVLQEQQQQQYHHPQQNSCFGQQPYFEQQLLRQGQEYQYKLAGQMSNHWGNTPSKSSPSMPAFSDVINKSHHSSIGASYQPPGVGNTMWTQTPPGSLMDKHTENPPSMPVLSHVCNKSHQSSTGAPYHPPDDGNTMWVPTPPGSLIDKNRENAPTQVHHQLGQNIGYSKDCRFTQHVVSPGPGFTFPNQSQTLNFPQNHWPIFYQNLEQNVTLRQCPHQDDRCWSPSTNSTPSSDVSLPPGNTNNIATNIFPQFHGASATPYFGPANVLNPSQDINLGPGHYPTPGPSPGSHDHCVPNFQTYHGLQCAQPSAMSRQYPNTSIDPSAGGVMGACSEGFSATKCRPSEGKLSRNCSSSHQNPSNFGNHTYENQSFGIRLPLPPTPPPEILPSALASSRAMPQHQHKTHKAPTCHNSHTQPEAYGVRLWMAMGDSLSSTKRQLNPDPNRPFTYYSNITGVQVGDRDNLSNGGLGTAAGSPEEDEAHPVSQVLQEVNCVLTTQ